MGEHPRLARHGWCPQKVAKRLHNISLAYFAEWMRLNAVVFASIEDAVQ